MERRTCWSCKQEKPLTDFVRSRSGTRGYGSTCKTCKRQIYNKRRYGGAEKRCIQCKQVKQVTDFWLAATQKDGRGNRCKRCCELLELLTGKRACKRCLKVKPLSEYSQLQRWQGKHDHWCKECRTELVVAWNRGNKERAKRTRKHARLSQNYGMSLDEFEGMLEEQRHCCALCGEPFEPNRPAKSARVDHCHATGSIRGLLHANCNVLIGMAEESEERLKAAIAYLQKYGKGGTKEDASNSEGSG